MHEDYETLAPEFFQSLVDIISAELKENVNITDKDGIIIASYSKERIGQLHEAGARMLRSEKIQEFSVTEEDERTLSGVRRGYNVPILFEDKCIGLIGVTGNPEEAAVCARLAVHFVEAALQSNVRQIKLLEALKEKQNLHLHYLKRIMQIQEEERRNISRELHDETSQALTSIIFGLRVLAESAKEEDREKILQMRDLAATTLDAVHQLAVKLRPVVLDNLGLITAAQKYIDTFSQKYAIEIHTTFSKNIKRERFSPEIEINLYRILQETLTNIAKHAQATHVDIQFIKRNYTLFFSICDNGIGFDMNKANPDQDRTCLGLYGIKERVSLLQGQFTLQSSPEKGTVIKVEIPLQGLEPTAGTQLKGQR